MLYTPFMKKVILILTLGLFFTSVASAQTEYIPSFQFGLKAGANFSTFPQYGDFKNQDEAGYIVGAWARVGGFGFNFQPEVYVTSKNVGVVYEPPGGGKTVNPVKFTSLDFPFLLGTKVGTNELGVRFYGGPVFSYAININEGFGNDIGYASRLDINDQNYALQVGAGLDFGTTLSIDLRYEEGLNKIAYGPDEYSHTRLNLFNLTLAYNIFSTY